MTLTNEDSIIIFMKRIATQKNGFWKRVVINIPFILMIALMVAMFGGGLLLLFYSIASCFAFKSAMVFLVIAGAGLIAIGIGIGFIEIYKKYYDFYNKKMGWEFPDAPKKEEKSVVSDGKKSFKDYLTVSNIAIVVLAAGAVFTIISAALGCINREKWVEATSMFMNDSGYLTEVEHRQTKDSVNEVEGSDKLHTIIVDFQDKKAVIVYTTDLDKIGFATYDYYIKYENQVIKTRSSDGVVTLTESPAPKRDDTVTKRLFFFMFKDFDVEKQVVIYLPDDAREGMPNEIKVVGENVTYANATPAETDTQD